jgi:hypothetical protein
VKDSSSIQSHGTNLEARPTVSVLLAALICSAVLITYLLITIIASAVGIELPRWFTVLVLFLAIHICAWSFLRGSRRQLLKRDLARLSCGCAIAFVLIDEGLVLAFQWAGLLNAPQQYATAKVVVATVFDVCLVVGIVFLTVPLGARIYGRRDVA